MAETLPRDLLRRYLLGELSEAARGEVEALVWAEDRLQDALDLAEDDLAEEYAMGALAPKASVAFEARIARSARLRAQVDLTHALRRTANLESGGLESVASATRPRSKPALTTSRGWPLALAATLVISIAGNVYLWRSSSATATLTGQVAALEADLAVRDGQLQALAGAVAELPEVFVVPLPATVTRSASVPHAVSVPSGSQAIVLRLPLPSDNRAALFAITVSDDGGATVWDTPAIAPDPTGQTASVVIPSKMLPPGQYHVLLLVDEPAGRRELAEFALRIRP